jgi:hypothetical protein
MVYIGFTEHPGSQLQVMSKMPLKLARKSISFLSTFVLLGDDQGISDGGDVIREPDNTQRTHSLAKGHITQNWFGFLLSALIWLTASHSTWSHVGKRQGDEGLVAWPSTPSHSTANSPSSSSTFSSRATINCNMMACTYASCQVLKSNFFTKFRVGPSNEWHFSPKPCGSRDAQTEGRNHIQNVGRKQRQGPALKN